MTRSRSKIGVNREGVRRSIQAAAQAWQSWPGSLVHSGLRYKKMFDELKVFLTVAEAKSFTKAAMQLNFSQPAVSRQIKKLEIFFNNTPLIQRTSSNKQIELTEEGKLVLQYGKDITRLMERLQEELGRRRDAELRPLRIGASMTVGNHLLPHLIQEFCKADRNTAVEIFIGNTRQVCLKLNNGEIDIGLIEGRAMDYQFKRKDFFTDPLVLAAPPHIAQSIRDFSPGNLGKLTWIVREAGSGTEQYLEAFLESNGIFIKNKIQCNSNEANCQLVKEGLGVTLISRLVVNQELRLGNLAALPMNRIYTRKFSYILSDHPSVHLPRDRFVQVLESMSHWFSWD